MPDVSPLTSPVRFRGRAHERGAAEALLDAARDGHGGALLVMGEPGIGRTALLDHLRATAGDDLRTLAIRGVPTETDLPFAGLHRLLRPLGGLLPALPAPQRDALTGALDSGTAGAHGVYLLSVAVLGLLAEAARETPLLVCVDDAHHLDAPSLDALAFAARRIDTEPAALVFTARDGRDGDDLPVVGVPLLRLDRLGDDDIRALLAESTAAPTVSEPVLRRLAGVAGGNPQAAVELAASLTPAQLAGQAPLPRPLRPRGRLWRTHADAIARLPGETRRLLLLMAAAEEDTEIEPAFLVLAAQRTGIDIGALEPAEDAGLVHVRDDAVVFRHPLVRSAAYDGAGLAGRRAAHVLLAEVFDAHGRPVRAAWHRAATALHPDEDSAAELEQVAVRERGRSGYAVSSRFLERAGELSPAPAARAARLTEAARDAWLSGGPRRARVLLDRVRALSPDDDVADAADAAEAAGATVGAEVAVAADGAEVAGGGPQVQTGAAGGAGGAGAADGADGADAAHDGPQGRAGGPEALRSHAELLRGHAELLRGDIELRAGIAVDAHEALSAAAERLLPRRRDLAVRALLQAGEASCLAGDHRRYFATAERLAALRRPGDTGGAADAETDIMFDFVAGKSAMLRGHHHEAIAPLRRAIAAAERLGEPAALVWGGVSGLLLGDPVRAHTLTARAVAAARRVGALSVVPQALEYQCYAELWMGRLAQVREAAGEGLRLAEETGQHNCAGHHRAVLAMVAAMTGDTEGCRAHAAAALDLAGAHDLGLPAALATWALARLDLAGGRNAEAAIRLRTLASAGPGRGHIAVRLLSTPDFIEAAVRTGDPSRARASLRSFQAWAEATGSEGTRAVAARCLGLLAEATPGDPADGERGEGRGADARPEAGAADAVGAADDERGTETPGEHENGASARTRDRGKRGSEGTGSRGNSGGARPGDRGNGRGQGTADRGNDGGKGTADGRTGEGVEAAVVHFGAAMGLHRRGYWDVERARTELLLGNALRRARRPRESRDHLHAALETFERVGAGPWARQARAELRATGEPARSDGNTAHEALSPQQLQIANLVAEGATNREAAARLYLSPRTVDHHLRNIFTKLGIRSRVELAHVMARREA
ncbi:AAA family ATPase [Nocardiopsis sediminis]|uniref:AAA family ATPase n=1 Tax=Nocardiopsis sediminis TaxID=1778267 RepID=A0ABV8FK21_9ACTN